MKIGPLRHRITIQTASTTQDAAGEETGTLANLASVPTVWADVRPASGNERFIGAAEQEQATLTHKVTIRYRTDLSVEMIVLWETRRLKIQSIQEPSGKRENLLLLCEEVLT